MSRQQKNLTAITIAFGCAAMFGPLATGTYLPAFFQIADEFAVSAAQVQQTLSLYLLAYAIMALFHGTLSDTFGRKPVLLFAVCVFGLSSLGAMLAPSFGWLLFFRVIQGMTAGCGMIISQAMIRDRFDGPAAQKMMANVMMVFSLAPAIAPVVGGYITAHASWRGTFAALVLFSVFVLAYLGKVVPETLPQEQRRPFRPGEVLTNSTKLIKNRRFVWSALAAATCFAGFALYISSAAALVIRLLGQTESDFHWLFLPLIGGVVIGSAVNGKLAGNMSGNRTIQFGYLMMLIGMGINVLYNLCFSASLPWATLPLMVYSFGMALALPTISMTALGMFPQMRGLAASLINFMQMIIFALIAGLIAPLLFGSALHIALGGLCTVIVSSTCWYISARSSR